MAKSRSKKEKPVFPFWQDCVETLFTFCKKELGDEPSFDGSSPRDFRVLLESLKKRHEGKDLTWTKEAAISKLYSFLTYCKKDKWISENFTVFNLNRQKDKIFFKIAKEFGAKENVYANQVSKARSNFKPIE